MAARQPAPPPGKLTLREAVATVAVFAVITSVMGLAIDDWDSAIGGGLSAAGANLLHRWWQGRTAQPEYEDEGGDDVR